MGGTARLRTWWSVVVRDPYTLLLIAAFVVQATFVLSPGFEFSRAGFAIAACALFCVLCVLACTRYFRADRRFRFLTPYVLILLAGLWRVADRDFATGIGALVVAAVVWVGFYGTLAQVWTTLGVGAAVLLLASSAAPDGLLAVRAWSRVGLVVLLGALAGATLNSLVRRGTSAAAEARANGEIYKLLVENLPLTTVMLLDENLRCVSIGGHWLRKSNTDRADYVGQSIFEFFSDNDQDAAREFYARAAREPAEEQMSLHGGRFYEFTALPVPGPDGKSYTLSLARDITERRRAERERQEMLSALAVSEASFREAFEGAPIGVALTTADDGPNERFLRVNPAFAAILGRKPEDLAGMLVAEVTHPEDVTLYPDLSRTTGNPPMRKRFLRPSGRAVWTEVSYNVVRDHNGEPSHIVKQIQDIQTIKQSEQALLDALEQQRAATASLREIDRLRTELVATVSHELRTPLTSIRGYLELLADEGLSAPQLSLLSVAMRNTVRLGDLVDDLLVLVRLDSLDATGVFSTSDVEIAPAMSAVTDTVRPEVADRNQSLTVELPDVPAVVHGDADQIDRVLVNLLSNATKYTPAGGRIEVDVRIEGGEVVIAVSDNGIGIPADEQPQLFTRFFRASTARANAITGNGLGLAIVKTIVERHAGTVHVESAPGVGTTFTVRLPLAMVPARPAA